MISNPKDQIDLKQLMSPYLKKWKWFVICSIIAIFYAFIFIRYTAPKYAAHGKIQILEDKNSSSELAALKDINLLGGGENKVEDEIQIINSRSNFIGVVQKLGLNVQIIALGNVKDSEVYEKKPFKLNFIANDSVINASKFEFILELSSDTTFKYTVEEGNLEKVYSYGSNVKTEIGDIVITPNLPFFKKYKGKRIKVLINPIFIVAENYQKETLMTTPDKLSNIINISLTDPIKKKAIDIINSLIFNYNKNAIDDKKIIADRTSEFINERIADLSTNLTSVDQSAQDFKTDKGLTDVATEANLALNIGAESRQLLDNAKTQLNIASSMKQYVSEESGYNVLPSNVGISDPTIANTTAKYNELVLERNRLLKSADEQNPIIVNLNQQLDGLKESMQSSLSGMERNLGMQVNNLSGQLSRFNSKIYSAPKNERLLRDITRQQQTTESLYLYLLQKREESQITFASSEPKSKIIDYAYQYGEFPVYPKKSIVYLASLLLGLLVPFGVIYVKDLLDTKIHNKHSLEEITKDLPVLGELPFLSKKHSKIIVNADRSVLAEALRILRTNLDFLISTKNDKDLYNNNVVLVTSSVPGEGKTFVSTNLSMILASTNKKVLLVGADIRNPKLYSFFSGDSVDKFKIPERNKDAGLTEYLINDTLKVKDVIKHMLVYNNTIDVIYSGKIPPNPGELLMNTRMGALVEEVASEYDYVIMDTAPLMVVSDTLLLTKFSNHIIYVTRAGVTDKNAIQFPIDLHKEGKLNGVSFVVNGVSLDNLGYGGQYGYGYGKTTKKWWKF